jgi:NAD(P)-dependent dehydrogenase (short-subunit alcohol dehydrogenase family)
MPTLRSQPHEPSSVAVVTGGARGIGRGIAERLVDEGYVVVVTDVAGEDARRTAVEIGAAAGVEQDVREESSHAKVAATAAELGTLAIWVNNAGVGDVGRLAELTSEQVQRIIDVNVMGVLWGTRAALGAFGSAGGDVINVASVAGLGPTPTLAVYGASKAAVVSLSMSVALETPRSVRVHALCPDGVDTDMVAEMPDDAPAKAIVHSSGRLRTVAEVVDAAIGLIGSDRVVRSVPAWRSPLVRVGAFVPTRMTPGYRLLEAFGRRVMSRG